MLLVRHAWVLFAAAERMRVNMRSDRCATGNIHCAVRNKKKGTAAPFVFLGGLA
jgi:hypothetical protein